jgi:hypothetical protein
MKIKRKKMSRSKIKSEIDTGVNVGNVARWY